jgi:hypothetical protein
LSPTLQKDQRTQCIDGRGCEDKQQQKHRSVCRAVDVRRRDIVGSAAPCATPMPSQGAPERGRTETTVKLPTSLAQDCSRDIFHTALPFFVLPSA